MSSQIASENIVQKDMNKSYASINLFSHFYNIYILHIYSMIIQKFLVINSRIFPYIYFKWIIAAHVFYHSIYLWPHPSLTTQLCFGFNWEGIKLQRSPNKGVRPSPFMLVWVTNMSTSPNLYIEFSTDPWASRYFSVLDHRRNFHLWP